MTDTLFSSDYRQARTRFLTACREAGLAVDSHVHPEAGLDGEELATDVCRIGRDDADNVIFVTSATHGVEGFGGSGIQCALLGDLARLALDDDTALVLVHAVNPFGFSWLRRVNEDNIDLNRNFVDHASGNYPENELFEELVPYAVPRTLDATETARCASALEALGEKHGEVAVRKALTKGQYRHPDSVHYGGNQASWSNRTLQSICDQHCRSARRAVLVDLHTGLGPYGYGELMTPSKPGEGVYDRLHAWFGDEVHSTTAGASGYAGSKGSILAGFSPSVSTVQWTPVGLEFGTLDSATVRAAMCADVWLYVHGDPHGESAGPIRRQVRDAFYIDEARWKHMLVERGLAVIGRLAAIIAEEKDR